MNSRNDVVNGDAPSGRSDHYDGPYKRENPSSGSVYSSLRDRRAGAYGGFYDAIPPSTSLPGTATEHHLTPKSSRLRIRDAESGQLWSATRDEGRYGGSGRSTPSQRLGTGAQQIDDVLQAIQQEWDFMIGDDCTPVRVALQLMDPSTLGKAEREPDFLRMNKQIQRALKSIVNEHHQGFNSSIGTYHKIQSSIQSSQSRIRLLKSSLVDAKSGLLTTKPELKGLATASQNYDDVLQLFAQIDNIQALPEALEARISEKRFIAAVEILQEALRLTRKSELHNIGGLGDLRTYFSNQEVSLSDILIEELHDHLYLKSPYCQDRWKGSTPNINGDSNSAVMDAVASWETPVYRFLSSLDVTTPLVEDATRNPEADTFYYIHLIIEALNKMGHLEAAVDRIEQRLPVELFAVVDKTNAEVDTRYPIVSSRDGRISNLPSEVNADRGPVLSEFLWTLYAKFEAIAEGHRVVHDVIAGIVEREGIRKSGSLTGGFKELWKVYQSEMRSLLHDYLTTDGNSSFRPEANASDEGYSFASVQRDKTKKIFKLSDVDGKSSGMKAEQDELNEILRASVPGLVSKSRHKVSSGGPVRSRQGNSGTGHKLLIEPSVFNMSLLLPPSLSFIQRLKDIVPPNSDIIMSTLTSFLDNFLINVFHPQLDEAVTDLCAMSFIAIDAFTEDSQWSRFSPKPIFKGTIAFMNLVKSFSKMLDNIPHDQALTQLVVNQIVTYYDKCCGWYKALVTRMSSQNAGGIRLKAAAAYTEPGELRDILTELWGRSGPNRQELIIKEIDLLIKYTNETPLAPYDIVSDPKTVLSLSLLYNSMNWLTSNLSRLRHITPHQADSSRPQSGSVQHTRRWTLITAMKPKRDSISQPIYLPMTQESVAAFDTTLQSLRALALTALFTLHVDIRCGAIHMITRSLAGGNAPEQSGELPTSSPPNSTPNWSHILSSQPMSASPAIVELNNDLISFNANISTSLGEKERQFITSGLARMTDRAFVSGTRFIGAMNGNGALRLQLDVLVLQQNLKNIIISPSSPAKDESNTILTSHSSNGNNATSHYPQETVALPRSAKFLDWFLEGPDKAVQYAKEEKEAFKNMGSSEALEAGNGEPFAYDELKVLVELCFSAVLKGPRGAENREDLMAAKRANGDALLRLSEVMWDS